MHVGDKSQVNGSENGNECQLILRDEVETEVRIDAANVKARFTSYRL